MIAVEKSWCPPLGINNRDLEATGTKLNSTSFIVSIIALQASKWEYLKCFSKLETLLFFLQKSNQKVFLRGFLY